jgi:hypothetical protein
MVVQYYTSAPVLVRYRTILTLSNTSVYRNLQDIPEKKTEILFGMNNAVTLRVAGRVC